MYRIILSGAHKDINGPDLGSILDVVQWAAFNNMLYDPGFKVYKLNGEFPKLHSATARFRCFDVARLENLPMTAEEEKAIFRGAKSGQVPNGFRGLTRQEGSKEVNLDHEYQSLKMFPWNTRRGRPD